MCLAVPAEIVALKEADQALVSVGGIRKTISVALIDDPRPGEFVILHVGYALARVDEAEARRTLALLEAEGGLAETIAEMTEAEAVA